MNTNSRTPLFPFLWAMLFDHTSLNITFPILTLLFFDTQSHLFPADTSHAVRSMWYGLCVAIPHLMNIIAAPILSALSDQFGRKKILLMGALGAFLFALTAAFGIMWGMLSLVFLGRVIQGLFSRTNPVAQAVMGDISTAENKVIYMGYLQFIISIGAFLGPIIGGYFANRFFFSELNFSLPFFIATFLAGVSCLVMYFFFEETLKPVHITHCATRICLTLTFSEFRKIIFKPTIFFTATILLFSQISWSMYYQFTPPVLKTVLGFDAHQLGFFVGLIAFWLAVASGIGIKILGRFFTLEKMLTISLYSVLIGLMLNWVFSVFHFTFLVWLAAIPIAMGDVIAYSCITALFSNAVGPDQQGRVMAIGSIIVAIVWALTGLLGGVLMSLHPLLPLMIAPIGILFPLFIVYRKKESTSYSLNI